MPLNKSCNLEAYRANVSELIHSGRKPNQAVAIAIRTLKKACGVTSEKRMKPCEIVKESVDRSSVDILRKLAGQLKEFAKGMFNGYDDFDQVLSKFEELGVPLRPTSPDYEIMRDFKVQREREDSSKNVIFQARGYWQDVARQCNTVADCLRIYGLALDMETPGLEDSFQKRAIELANQERWQ